MDIMIWSLIIIINLWIMFGWLNDKALTVINNNLCKILEQLVEIKKELRNQGTGKFT